MAQNITLLGANYPDVPAVQLPITGGGTATFSDTRSVTYNLSSGATASVNSAEVVAGQGFSVKLKAPVGYNLSGVTVTMGGNDITSQVFTPDEAGGGGGGSITVTEQANATGITCVITTSSEPTPPEPDPGDIPLNTELVDYTTVRTGYYVDDANGAIVAGESWNCVTDYIQIDPSMTFSFVCPAWYGVGFYDSSKTPIRGITSNDLGTVQNDYVHGTITPSVIPSNAVYCVLTGSSYSLSANYLSLIRTA
jgi:hypothetical protein